MKSALASAGRVAGAVRATCQLQGDLSANTILSMIHDVSRGIKTSTSSKIAYFSGIEAIEGKCLIFDERVIASIFYHRFEQLKPLIRKMLPRKVSSYSCLGEQIEDATSAQEKSYGPYVECLNSIANEHGLQPDELESYIFAVAPSRTTMKAINGEWEAIRNRQR